MQVSMKLNEGCPVMFCGLEGKNLGEEINPLYDDVEVYNDVTFQVT